MTTAIITREALKRMVESICPAGGGGGGLPPALADWSFAADFADISGNGYDLTASSDNSPTDDPVVSPSGTVAFDSSKEQSLVRSGGIPVIFGDFTLAIRLSVHDPTIPFLGIWAADAGSPVSYVGNGGQAFDWTVGSDNVLSSVTVVADTEYLVIYEYDDTAKEIRITVNGTTDVASHDGSVDLSTNFQIGNDTGAQWWDGYVKRTRIWPQLLTPTQKALL